MARLTTEARVGLFVLLGIILLVYMSLKLGEFHFGRRGGYEIYAIFDSAAGLKLNVPAEIAGVEVGRVMGVELEAGKAKVRLRIRPGVKLSTDATATIRTKGLLGDRYIEIQPGTPTAEPLPPGGTIVHTVTPPEMDQLLTKLGQIGDDIRQVTWTLSQVLGGKEGAASLKQVFRNIRELSENLNMAVKQNMEHFDAIMANLDRFSHDIREMSGENKEDFKIIVANMKNTSKQLEEAITAVRQVVDKVNRGEGFLGRLVNDPETAANLDATLASLKEVSDKINRGEGSLGKLVNDEETVDNLNEALGSINRVLSQQERFKTYLSYRGEYLVDGSDLKSYASLRIQPRPDKYYLLSVVDVPKRGDRSDGIKVSAQIAKRYQDVVLRGGVLESTGGVGLDYYLLDDSLKFSFEAFDFEDSPHLKLYADYTFLQHLFVTMGWDDFVGSEGDASFFFGAGVRFLDEDIKALLGGGATAAAAARK
ncbi:MAG: MCE family protein [Deltaproteobacteria bacterium]|nr:MCE family protein [Deltaproteobacteria bacterium]MBW2070221.1 MCE family protein [Deltaproteobacteria bacterium]